MGTLRDLLEYFPRDYQLESAERPIGELNGVGVQIARGEVVAVDYVGGRGRPRFEATLADGGARLALCWFNASWLRGKIRPGLILRVQGAVKFRGNIPQMVQPMWEVIEPEAESVGEDRLRAIYAAGAKISSKFIEGLIGDHLEAAVAEVEEWFEPAILLRRSLMGRAEAYRAIHRPGNRREAQRARRRIVYDELMLLQLGLGLSKRFRAGRMSAPTMRIDKLLDERIRRRFAFALTGGAEPDDLRDREGHAERRSR